VSADGDPAGGHSFGGTSKRPATRDRFPRTPVALSSRPNVRIGLDATPLLRPRTGIGVFTDMLVLHARESGDEVVGLVSGYKRWSDGRPDLGLEVHENWVPRAMNPVFFDLLRWPKLEDFLGRIDMFIATNYLLPPARRAAAVAYIHDVGRLTHPELYGRRQVWRARILVRRCARNADLLVVPTEAVAREVAALGLVPRERMHVVPLAARGLPDPGDTEVAGVPRDAPFLLCVGSLERRKNIPFLLRAFGIASSQLPHHLVLAGGGGSAREEAIVAASANGAANRIHFLGSADERQLGALYRRADLTLCPSLYEGFGLPVLEAMSCGCPVLATDIAAHREVGGEAVRLTPIGDAGAFAESLVDLARDEGARRHLRSLGIARSLRFSWSETGRRLREALTRTPRTR